MMANVLPDGVRLMKKWPLTLTIAGVGGLALAFGLAQVLPNLRTSTSTIEVNINDPELTLAAGVLAVFIRTRTHFCC